MYTTNPLDFDPDASFQINERRFDRETFGITQTLPPDSIRFNIDDLQRHMLARMTAYVYAEDLGRYTHEYSYPSNWFEHLKRDHAPKWFIKRYPVKYTINTIRLTGKAMYPSYRAPRGYDEPYYIVREISL